MTGSMPIMYPWQGLKGPEGQGQLSKYISLRTKKHTMAKINNQPLKELLWFEQLERKWSCPHSYTHTWRWWKMDKIKTLFIIKEMEKKKGRPIRILSIGCGLAGDLFVLNLLWGEKYCFELTGLDIDFEKIHLLNYFKEKRKVENLTFLLGDAQSLPLKEGFFDIILCSEVLEHLPESERRSAKSSGYLFRAG